MDPNFDQENFDDFVDSVITDPNMGGDLTQSQEQMIQFINNGGFPGSFDANGTAAFSAAAQQQAFFTQQSFQASVPVVQPQGVQSMQTSSQFNGFKMEGVDTTSVSQPMYSAPAPATPFFQTAPAPSLPSTSTSSSTMQQTPVFSFSVNPQLPPQGSSLLSDQQHSFSFQSPTSMQTSAALQSNSNASSFSVQTPFPSVVNGPNFSSSSSISSPPPLSPASGLTSPSSTFTPNNVSLATTSQIYQPKPLQPSQQLLADIMKSQVTQKEQIEKIFQQQKQFMQAPDNAVFMQLAESQRSLKEQLELGTKALNQLFESLILEPPDLHRYFVLKQDIEVQLKQLDLLTQELQAISRPSALASTSILAGLMVVRQPFPLIVTKAKQITEEQLQVQLLTATRVQLQSVTQVKCSMVTDVSLGKGANAKMIDCDTQPLDPTSRVAKFPLKFLSGTKKAIVYLRFSMQVQLVGARGPVTVESNMSAPLVVITNECQWEDSAGALLKKDVFTQGQMEVSFFKFCNTLQHHVLKATRQELARPKRHLSQFDFRYLHNKFFNHKMVVNQKDFDSFWAWFGQAMQKLRYQRHISNLWQSGIIYGFMDREQVEAALAGQDPRTFLIRFSERHPSQFAIVYVSMDVPHHIKHYLVQPNDTAASKKTLPDFIMDIPQLQWLLVLTYDSQGNPSFVKTAKDQVLEPYSGKREHPITEKGYEPLD